MDARLCVQLQILKVVSEFVRVGGRSSGEGMYKLRTNFCWRRVLKESRNKKVNGKVY